MATLRIRGSAARNYFAEQIVKDQGPEKARENTCGPMLAAVERVIAAQAQKVEDDAKVQGFANWGSLD